jgi:hypothetical protein
MGRDGSESSLGTGVVRSGDQQRLVRAIGRGIESIIIGCVRGLAIVRHALRRT